METRIRCIYAIRHVATGKVYIGKTSNLYHRIDTHLRALNGNSHSVERFQWDYNNLGKEVEVFILCRLDGDIPFAMYNENIWFSIFQSTDEKYGYNYKEKHRRVRLEDFEKVPHKDEKSNRRRLVKLTGGRCKFTEIITRLNQNGISVSELGRELGIGDEAMRRRLNSDSNFTLDEMIQMAKFFDCGVEDLFPELSIKRSERT